MQIAGERDVSNSQIVNLTQTKISTELQVH